MSAKKGLCCITFYLEIRGKNGRFLRICPSQQIAKRYLQDGKSLKTSRFYPKIGIKSDVTQPKKGPHMHSKYFFSLEKIKPQNKFTGGSITHVTDDQVPGFENISFCSLKLNPAGSLEPIWHPNAHKIGYCIGGEAMVTMRTPSSVEMFTVQKGDVFFVPKGYIHSIANCGNSEVIIKFASNHDEPEMMCLSQAIYSLSDDVCKATFDTPPEFCAGLKKVKKHELISVCKTLMKPTQPMSNRYKFNIEKSTKTIMTQGGYLQLATKTNLPVLDGLGILGFGLNPKGVVEPHWHTNAGELVYIVKGHTRITILSPDGVVETLDVKGGEGAFAPASYFHNIENIGNEDVEVIAFFSHAEPDYMGIAEVIGTYSNEMLASIFNVSPNYFDALKKTAEPLVIVPT